MKKILLLVSLITALSSCGGGGGSGGSSQTGSVTPVPSNPNQPGNPNAQNPSQPGNNHPGNSNAQNPTQSGNNQENNFEKPNDNRIFEGNGVKIGVLDSDFLSNNAYTDSFYRGGLLNLGTEFGKVLTEEFGDRFTAIQKTLDTYSTLSEDDHGLMVATILAGKSGKGAKGASVYGVSFGERGGHLITDKLWNFLIITFQIINHIYIPLL